jgi:predicted acetyltransferase
MDTMFLASDGGHIGYDVSPSWRGQGYGHRALDAALVEARRLKINRVLLVADESNAASRAVIERHSDELESVAFSAVWEQPVCRYWIRVRRNDG